MPPSLLIHNAHIYAANGDWWPGWLLAEAGRITRLGRGAPPE